MRTRIVPSKPTAKIEVTPKKTNRNELLLEERNPKAAPGFRMYVMLKKFDTTGMDSWSRMDSMTESLVT